MDTTIAAVLVFGGPIMLAVFGIGIMALAGLVAFDVVSSRSTSPKPVRVHTREAAETRIYLERGIARAFVIIGGVFWGVSLVAAALWYERGLESMFFVALIPFLLNAASLIVGWRQERTASIMLALTSLSAVAWGVSHQFEPGVWVLFTALLIGPMMTASVLFWLARQGEIALELRFAQPLEPAYATAEGIAE